MLIPCSGLNALVLTAISAGSCGTPKGWQQLRGSQSLKSSPDLDTPQAMTLLQLKSTDLLQVLLVEQVEKQPLIVFDQYLIACFYFIQDFSHISQGNKALAVPWVQIPLSTQPPPPSCYFEQPTSATFESREQASSFYSSYKFCGNKHSTGKIRWWPRSEQDYKTQPYFRELPQVPYQKMFLNSLTHRTPPFSSPLQGKTSKKGRLHRKASTLLA